LSKKEKLQVDRLRAKLEKNLGSISDMTRLPGALFVVDIRREHIAIKEAQKLNIPIFAMVDTNADPRDVDYVIPANDDASKSIEKIMTLVTEAVAKGLKERQKDKADADAAASEGEVVASTESVEAAPVEKETAEEVTAEEVTAEEVVEEAKAEEVVEEAKAEEEAPEAVVEEVAEEVTEEQVVEVEEPAEDAVEEADEENDEETKEEK
jgi:small subunit ribosomal protein S2